jgi:tRNA threonylcarbamoyladenosine modification (KEOPS) complex  Pcc1 subunit
LNPLKTSPRKNQNPLPKKNPQTRKKPLFPLAEITIQIGLPSTKIATIIRKSIEPETRPTRVYRSRTTVTSRGRRLQITVRARDLVALRAACNSFLHFVAAALRTVQIVAPFYRARGGSKRRTLGQRF